MYTKMPVQEILRDGLDLVRKECSKHKTMKLFKNILNSVKPHFTEGGKLEKLYPAYDAFETFLFVPDHTSQSGTHIHDAID